MKKKLLDEFLLILREDQVKEDERLEFHTSLHIGGECDYLVTPSSCDEIKEVIRVCIENQVSFFVMGNGSNLLVSDKGYKGVIIKLGEKFSQITIADGGQVTAQAGVALSKLANKVAESGLSGFEFASGIPGTLGGAVTMNAGAYGGDMNQCVVEATVMDLSGDIKELNNEELELGYRTSILQKKDYILLEAVIKLEKGLREEIFRKMKDLNARRRDKQPLEYYSCGSTFKRPTGFYAGKLIEDSGLKGYTVGGASVSEKHSGFIINKGNATAKDFMTVIEDVKRIVYDKQGVRLEPEVRFLGDFE